ncbi:ATP-binding protein [Tistrella mobilis]|jgi:predicted AAA+ superfamily ATPase|uniref:ATP-binding protein n=1 Tax=Tistrella mobilis TaxID=171437 RepID=UPI003557103D
MTDTASASPDLLSVLDRIASALERMAPPPAAAIDLDAADAFVWVSTNRSLQPVPRVSRVDISLLEGVNLARDQLLDNTRRFAAGLPANNALLWGARGMGKSSLVKAVHAKIVSETPAGSRPLKLIEIHREDISQLPDLLAVLRGGDTRALLFCDDLSFDHDDTDYKSLKAVLDGGIEGRPDEVLFYATSNRRHLMPRDMIDNERSTAINPSEAIEEKVSLSDRFGLWLGFHACDQKTYLAMVHGYVAAYDLGSDKVDVEREALTWAQTRGGRSGRVAWQYIQDLAGRLGRRLETREG